jgi:hypothetical protein
MSSQNEVVSAVAAAGPRYAVLMRGLPITKKYDKLLCHLSKEPCSTRIWGRTKPIKTELLYDNEGVKRTTGEAIFLFEEDKDEKLIVRRSDGIRLDKSHTLGTRVIRVCKTCHCDTSLSAEPHAFAGQPCDFFIHRALDTSSKVDPDSCRSCVPDKLCCCCAKPLSDEIGDIYSKYVSCQSCRKNMEKQEAWRQSVPVHDTKSSYKEPTYLCSEAIQREKELLGGKPPVSEDWVTPFMISYCTDSLVDPLSGKYWPYGMSGKDYVKLQDERRFNNPMCETPDDSWRDIEVTSEITHDYWKRMISLQIKYDFKSLNDIGSLPTTMSKEDKSYRLVPDIHGFTCDDPTCQAIFHQQNDLDGGGYAALVATGLPIYTSRSGDLKGESVSDIGYGKEYCLACMMK